MNIGYNQCGKLFKLKWSFDSMSNEVVDYQSVAILSLKINGCAQNNRY